jgi:hypothetical protein
VYIPSFYVDCVFGDNVVDIRDSNWFEVDISTSSLNPHDVQFYTFTLFCRLPGSGWTCCSL